MAHATHLSQGDPAAHFAYGLNAILDGLDTRLRSHNAGSAVVAEP